MVLELFILLLVMALSIWFYKVYQLFRVEEGDKECK